jgi:hypothetical protein
MNLAALAFFTVVPRFAAAVTQ